MNPFVPKPAEIVERRHEAKNIYTYRLRLCEKKDRQHYGFFPGQFNMLYVFGVGEIPISISSDPTDLESIDHIIRVVGTVSRALGECKKGDILGLRGPFGSQWPLEETQEKDILFVTGGLGCAPVMGAIHYILKRRKSYGAVKILHGIKAPHDLIYQKKIQEWKKFPDTEVHLTSDSGDKHWKYHIGVVTNLLEKIELRPEETIVMMCGPEIMMHFAIKEFLRREIPPEQIYLSMERNMKCALGFCGHCQYGPQFICKDGPILRYDRIQEIFKLKEI